MDSVKCRERSQSGKKRKREAGYIMSANKQSVSTKHGKTDTDKHVVQKKI